MRPGRIGHATDPNHGIEGEEEEEGDILHI